VGHFGTQAEPGGGGDRDAKKRVSTWGKLRQEQVYWVVGVCVGSTE
jgi:hypothetical protein